MSILGSIGMGDKKIQEDWFFTHTICKVDEHKIGVYHKGDVFINKDGFLDCNKRVDVISYWIYIKEGEEIPIFMKKKFDDDLICFGLMLEEEKYTDEQTYRRFTFLDQDDKQFIIISPYLPNWPQEYKESLHRMYPQWNS